MLLHSCPNCVFISSPCRPATSGKVGALRRQDKRVNPQATADCFEQRVQGYNSSSLHIQSLTQRLQLGMQQGVFHHVDRQSETTISGSVKPCSFPRFGREKEEWSILGKPKMMLKQQEKITVLVDSTIFCCTDQVGCCWYPRPYQGEIDRMGMCSLW